MRAMSQSFFVTLARQTPSCPRYVLTFRPPMPDPMTSVYTNGADYR